MRGTTEGARRVRGARVRPWSVVWMGVIAVASVQGSAHAANCNRSTIRVIQLAEGQQEARCSFEFEITAKEPHYVDRARQLRLMSRGTQGGLLEGEVRLTTLKVWKEQRGPAPWLREEVPQSEWPRLFDDTGSPSPLQVRFNGEPAVGTYAWQYRERFTDERDVALDLDRAGDWDLGGSVFVAARFRVELIVRRVRAGCWVTGAVLAPQARGDVTGDYAFWSDNPTGIIMGDDETPADEMVATEEEVEETVETIAGMDAEALAELGVDAGDAIAQAQAMMAGAQQSADAEAAEAWDDAVNSAVVQGISAPSIQEEFAEFAGKTFVTLQSTKNGAPETLGSADIGAVSIPTLPTPSFFSLTLVLDADFGAAEDLTEVWGNQTVLRAGLWSRGLMWRYPDPGAPTPIVLIGACPEGQPAAAGSVCGTVSWEGVVKADFRAGPGAFSCINN